MASSNASVANQSLKGLVNNPGDNNCFLNATIQVLWHLPLFRNSLSSLFGHYCLSGKCVFCALKTLFIRLEKVDKAAIPPDVLRRSMSDAFHTQDRFQLGRMDDAAECYEHLLSRLHYHLAPDTEEDTCAHSHCISHAKCALSVLEQSCCGCGEQSEPFGFSQFVHYVSAPAITSSVMANKAGPALSFGRYIRNATESIGSQPCSSGCGGHSATRRYLINSPSLMCLGVIWDSETVPVNDIMLFVNTIEETVTLDDVFSKVTEPSACGKKLHLVGMVMYYGLHYCSLFYSRSAKKWVFFDDSNVRVLDDKLSTVKDLCRRAHYQPLLLVYSDPNAKSVDFDSAPESVIPMSSDQERKTLKTCPVVDRSVTLRRSLSSATSPLRGGTNPLAQTPAGIAMPATCVPIQAAPTGPLIDLSSIKPAAVPRQVVEPSAPPISPKTPGSCQSSPRTRPAHAAITAEERREVQIKRDRMKSSSGSSGTGDADLINFDPSPPLFAFRAMPQPGFSGGGGNVYAVQPSSQPPYAISTCSAQAYSNAMAYSAPRPAATIHTPNPALPYPPVASTQPQPRQSQVSAAGQAFPRAQAFASAAPPQSQTHQQDPRAAASRGVVASAFHYPSTTAQHPSTSGATTAMVATAPTAGYHQVAQPAPAPVPAPRRSPSPSCQPPSDGTHHLRLGQEDGSRSSRSRHRSPSPTDAALAAQRARSDSRATGASTAPTQPDAESDRQTSMSAQVEAYCNEADVLLTQSVERDSESRLHDAMKCINAAKGRIQLAVNAASGDQRLLGQVRSLEAMILQVHASLERRINKGARPRPHPTTSGGGSSGASTRPMLAMPAAGTSGDGLQRTPSPSPESLNLFLSGFGDTSQFNTKPSNHSGPRGGSSPGRSRQ